MNELTGELHTLAMELIAAGVPATVDPGQLLRIVNQTAGVCALIEPPDVQPGMGMATLELTVPVRIVTHGPYDHNSVERVDGALLLALPVLQPRESVTWDTYDAADTPMPCRLVTTYRRIPFPLTVHP